MPQNNTKNHTKVTFSYFPKYAQIFPKYVNQMTYSYILSTLGYLINTLVTFYKCLPFAYF